MGVNEKALAAGRAAYAAEIKKTGDGKAARRKARRARYKADREGCREIDAQSRARLRKETLAAYGDRCQNPACNETEAACLTIDHVFDDGAEERRTTGRKAGRDFYIQLRRLGFPKDRYQLLCHNCQYRKRKYGPDIESWPRPYAG